MVNITEIIDDTTISNNNNPVTTTAAAAAAAAAAPDPAPDPSPVAGSRQTDRKVGIGIGIGTKVKIHGLKTASQHNGKIGVVVKTTTTTSGNINENENETMRVGVKLLPVQLQKDDGSTASTTTTTKSSNSNNSNSNNKVLAVKLSNLEVVLEEEKIPSTNQQQQQQQQQQKQRELKRQVGLLEEFDGTFEYDDPDTLVLYYHLRDRAFDCFNPKEYQTQLLNYLNHGMIPRLVLPRKIRQRHKYWLIGLQSVDSKTGNPTDDNVLCDVAFQAGRSFTGISMLIKHKCFQCNNPLPSEVELCRGCLCVCFCKPCLLQNQSSKHSSLSQQTTWTMIEQHQQLVCDRIDKSKIIMETECIQLL